MKGYILLEDTVKDFQLMLKSSALAGVANVTAAEIMHRLRDQPVYDLDKVIEDVSYALAVDNSESNILTGDGSQLVVVDKDKFEQIIEIIRNGGTCYGESNRDAETE